MNSPNGEGTRALSASVVRSHCSHGPGPCRPRPPTCGSRRAWPSTVLPLVPLALLVGAGHVERVEQIAVPPDSSSRRLLRRTGRVDIYSPSRRSGTGAGWQPRSRSGHVGGVDAPAPSRGRCPSSTAPMVTRGMPRPMPSSTCATPQHASPSTRRARSDARGLGPVQPRTSPARAAVQRCLCRGCRSATLPARAGRSASSP